MDINTSALTRLAVLVLVVVGVGVGGIMVLGGGSFDLSPGEETPEESTPGEQSPDEQTPGEQTPGGEDDGEQPSGGPTLSVQDVQVGAGETATTTLEISEAPDGVSGFTISVAADTDAVAITEATVSEDFQLREANVTDGNGRVVVQGVDLRQNVQSGAGRTELATITVRGESQGESALGVGVDSMDTDEGEPADPAIRNGTATVS